jgi:methylmalonyl-CoA/ethylmalonyl-CoA epimerase
MNISKIEHIGIAVKNMEKSIKLFEALLGTKCYAIEEVPNQKVKTAFFKVGQTKIELLESTSSEGSIAKFIEKRGEGVHHIAFKVDNIEEALNKAKDEKLKPIDEKPRKGAEGMNIAFLHPKYTNGVLIELCEDN